MIWEKCRVWPVLIFNTHKTKPIYYSSFVVRAPSRIFRKHRWFAPMNYFFSKLIVFDYASPSPVKTVLHWRRRFARVISYSTNPSQQQKRRVTISRYDWSDFGFWIETVFIPFRDSETVRTVCIRSLFRRSFGRPWPKDVNNHHSSFKCS